jgi:hypothetical protein
MLAAACSKAEQSSSTSDQTPGPLGSPSAQTPATTDSSQTQAALPDGRSFGYIKTMSASNRTLSFDLAQFLEGDAADRAAAEDGAIAPGEQVENDYYIRNQNPRLRTLTYTPDVRIRVVGDPPDLVDGELSAFVDSFSQDNVEFGPGRYRGSHTQYWLTVQGGVVTKIEELYLP